MGPAKREFVDKRSCFSLSSLPIEKGICPTRLLLSKDSAVTFPPAHVTPCHVQWLVVVPQPVFVTQPTPVVAVYKSISVSLERAVLCATTSAFIKTASRANSRAERPSALIARSCFVKTVACLREKKYDPDSFQASSLARLTRGLGRQR